MDLLACAALALITSLLSAHLGYSGGPKQTTRFQLFAVSFVFHYLSLNFYRIYLYHKYFSPLRHLPGPKDSHWFLGQALNQVNADTPMSFPVKLSRQHPEAPLIRYLSLANTEIILVNNLEAHRQVLQTHNDLFERPSAIRRMMKRFSGDGLTSFESDEYRAHRKVLSGCFTPDCIRKLEPVFKEKVAQLSLLFGRAIEASGGATAVIDCTDTFGRHTLDVMGRTLLGMDLSYLEQAEFDRDGNLVKGKRQYGFLDAYNAVSGPDKIGKVFTFLDGFFPIRWIPCNNTNFKFLRATKWMDTTIEQLVTNRRKELEASMGKAKHNDTSRDILSLLLEESMPGGCAEGIEDKNIVGHLLILLAGGHETSAHMLAWSSHVLATRPEIQNRLSEDILAVWTPRQAYHDVHITGTYIPKGTIFEIVPAVTHMNPLIWGEDAAEFEPSRWDTIGGADDPRSSPFAFEAFSNGPKTCIGKKLGLYEIKIALFEMVRSYRSLSVDEEEFGPFTVETPGIVLRPKGMKVRAEKIENA
ncbi:hypothetical protein FJTKL_10108 [Diaporthe vaccinii]|uniref:Cytochrome P450 n=1 Tax=Diaporthe vaccinii TaxID=105482 RepID=A0ABR4ELE2_9PEZI